MPETQSATQPASQPKGALSLTIDVTERCNLKCSYCYKGEAGKRRVNVPAVLETIERLWPVVVEHGGLTVSFMGGEPTIALDDVLRLVEELNDRCTKDTLRFFWGITSNLTLLTPKRADRILAASGTFHCSIDGIPTSQDKNRPYAGGHGSSADVIRHVNVLRERDALQGVRMTITPATIGQMLDGMRHLHAIGFTSIAAFPAFDRQTWTPNLMKTVEEQARLIGEARMTDLKGLTRLHPFDAYARLLSAGPSDCNLHCGACHSFLGIDVDGRIFPCHRFTGQAGWESYELRTLNGQGLGSWSQLRSAFKRTVSERCQSCPALGACHGGCWAENLSMTGSLSEPCETSCAYNLALYAGIGRSGYRPAAVQAEGACTGCSIFDCVLCDGCHKCQECMSCISCENWRGVSDGGCAVPVGST